MDRIYLSKKKIIYRVISVVMIVIICVITVASIPNDKEDDKNNDKQAKSENLLIDINNDNKEMESTEDDLDTPENIDGSMEDESENATDDETKNNDSDNSSSKVSEVSTTNKTVASANTVSNSNDDSKTTNSTNITNTTNTTTTNKNTSSTTKTTTSTEEKSKKNNSSNSESSSEQKQEDQKFDEKVYNIPNSAGTTVYITLVGTNNAYADGKYSYKDGNGNKVSKTWCTNLSNSGFGEVKFSVPSGATNVKFHLLWAGVWNEDQTVAIATECTMRNYALR